MRAPSQALTNQPRRRCGSAPKRIQPVGERIDAVAEHDRLGFGGGAVVGNAQELDRPVEAVEQRRRHDRRDAAQAEGAHQVDAAEKERRRPLRVEAAQVESHRQLGYWPPAKA